LALQSSAESSCLRRHEQQHVCMQSLQWFAHTGRYYYSATADALVLQPCPAVCHGYLVPIHLTLTHCCTRTWW
jgi:hypothetical protein